MKRNVTTRNFSWMKLQKQPSKVIFHMNVKIYINRKRNEKEKWNIDTDMDMGIGTDTDTDIVTDLETDVGMDKNIHFVLLSFVSLKFVALFRFVSFSFRICCFAPKQKRLYRPLCFASKRKQFRFQSAYFPSNWKRTMHPS
jgi:hypothetical protein